MLAKDMTHRNVTPPQKKTQGQILMPSSGPPPTSHVRERRGPSLRRGMHAHVVHGKVREGAHARDERAFVHLEERRMVRGVLGEGRAGGADAEEEEQPRDLASIVRKVLRAPTSATPSGGSR